MKLYCFWRCAHACSKAMYFYTRFLLQIRIRRDIPVGWRLEAKVMAFLDYAKLQSSLRRFEEVA